MNDPHAPSPLETKLMESPQAHEGPRGEILRIAAFSKHPAGGNPAGVVLADAHPPADEMQRIAQEVGYSETAFLEPVADQRYRVRYFSPEAEVPFCGHATVAAGVALTERLGPGSYAFETQNGVVLVETSQTSDGASATLTSVPPRMEPASDPLVDRALELLGWRRDQLDPRFPPAKAFAGAWHLILMLRDRRTLTSLDYDFQGLRDLMLREDLTTLQLAWQESPVRYRVRDPFPVGGVVEDPATGAAAAAFGAYLRHLGSAEPPAKITLLQGEEIGRPSELTIELVPAEARVRVSGYAVRIPNAT